MCTILIANDFQCIAELIVKTRHLTNLSNVSYFRHKSWKAIQTLLNDWYISRIHETWLEYKMRWRETLENISTQQNLMLCSLIIKYFLLVVTTRRCQTDTKLQLWHKAVTFRKVDCFLTKQMWLTTALLFLAYSSFRDLPKKRSKQFTWVDRVD